MAACASTGPLHLQMRHKACLYGSRLRPHKDVHQPAAPDPIPAPAEEDRFALSNKGDGRWWLEGIPGNGKGAILGR